jgi:ABC-type transport system substrate-binding protein
VLSETSDFKSAISPITAIEAVDDHTVRITTAAPNPILPDQLNSIPMRSKRWAEQHDVEPAALSPGAAEPARGRGARGAQCSEGGNRPITASQAQGQVGCGRKFENEGRQNRRISMTLIE